MEGFPEILTALRSLTEPAVLATLVRVKGSSYRKPGARMVMESRGARTGVLSAGCLEADLMARVTSILASGLPQVPAYDLGSELDRIWGTGMGCQGQADVFLEPITPGLPAPWMTLCEQLLQDRRAGVLATVFAVRGTTGLQVGDRFVLDSQGQGLMPAPGRFAQTLEGAMREALAQRCSSNRALPSELGEVDLLIEPVQPPHALWIFGAGEHARPLARFAKALGWYLGIVDHRPALATPERFPEADRIVVGRPPESLRGLHLDARTAALVVSHVYEQDGQVVEALLRQPLGYLGLQGNRTRCARMLQEIEAGGQVLTASQRQILHAPAGLDIGAEAPDAIALSMLAEIQAVFSGHPGGSLRARQGPIHGATRPPTSAQTPSLHAPP